MRVLAIIAAASVALCSTAAAASPANQTTRPAAVAAAAQVPASNLATQTDEQGKLLLMLDASGSMKAKDPSGLTKIEAAKKALTGVVGALPATAQVGLRVYGAQVDGKGKPTPAACADTRLVAPIAPLDKAGLTSTIGAIKA
ncbi:VWA domain-containing protein, partial [Knoellia flava]|uniref:VWA domain-containing protein n=1 Tax=Knoellia flava TaxID=913969 RepID=UPI00055B494A